MATTILILAAGQGSFEDHSSHYPLCLTEVEGVSLLERIFDGVRNLPNATFAFAFLNNEVERFHLDKVAKLIVPDATIVRVPESTQGSACTALLAASQLNPDNELLIISANELIDIDLSEVVYDFRDRALDGGVLVFRSVHPRYSYVRLNPEGYVVEAAQQEPISHNATAGIFWFSRTKDFVQASMSLIRKNASNNGKFYVAPAFNELILDQARIGVKELDLGKYTPLKNETQIQQFEYGSR
jgi:hypothetical protein